MQHKINELKLVTDENIQPEVVAFLRKKNFDVFDIKELNYIGKSDDFIFKFANKEKRVIVTHDSDFGRLLFSKTYQFSGIIYLRPGHFNPQVSIKSIEILISQNLNVNFPFIITVDNNLQKVKMRIRELKI